MQDNGSENRGSVDSRRPFTRFSGLGRWKALAVLAGLGVAIAACLLSIGPKKQNQGPPPERENDLRLYAAIVDHVRNGEAYYDAAGRELRERGYGTRSIFNWRPPVYAWVMASLPGPVWGQRLLAVLAVVAMIVTFAAIDRGSGPLFATACSILLITALHPCFIDASEGVYLSTELWAGTLILLSISLDKLGAWKSSVIAGLLALFFRELALPFVLIALGLAWWQGRRGEAVAWAVGLTVYLIGFAIHSVTVIGRLTVLDRADPAGWIQWGGLRFILETVSMNGVLLKFPAWVTAVYLPLSLLGLAGWMGPMARKVGIVVVVYLAIFAVVGKPFNLYWGLLDCGLLCLGAAWSLVAVRDLIVAVWRNESGPEAVPS
jgi:hypothetical protein